MALRTITPKHRDLRRISIYVTYSSTLVYNNGGYPRETIANQTPIQWWEIDDLLVQLWESHPIPPKILYEVFPWDESGVCNWVAKLLPETTERGTVDLVNAF